MPLKSINHMNFNTNFIFLLNTVLNKQLSKFEKGQIVARYHYGLSLCGIAKKLNCHHSSIDVFHKNKKTKLSSKKEVVVRRKKSLHLMGQKLNTKVGTHCNIESEK